MNSHKPNNSTFPLVSIGIPTYNRGDILEDAIKSAIEQEYPNVEVVICDNASTDGTAELCAKWVERNPRIHYKRHEVNLGATANFKDALALARGEYFMWLADDDWIEPGYITNCVRYLETNKDCFLACGKVTYYRDGTPVREGEEITIDQETRQERVVSFCATVQHNAVYYGMMRRLDLLRIPILQTIGNDFLVTIAASYSGKVMTVDGPRLCRRTGGISASATSVLADVNMSPSWIHFPFVLAYKQILRIFLNIVWECPVYRDAALSARVRLATSALITLSKRADLSPVAAVIQKIRNTLSIRKRVERLAKSLRG